MADRAAPAEDGSGAEISMSIEETNKLRISLGLKPLTMDNSAAKEHEAGQERRKAAEDAVASKALAERIAQAKERRRQEAVLRSTAKLGEADEHVGNDTLAWIERSRKLDAARKREAAARAATASAAVHSGDDEVKHTADDLEAGESVILTLEDRGILDDKGNLVEDEDAGLENILVRETKDREKAYRAAGKVAKPLWEEDGKQRGLLDKYDEEEEQALRLDEHGGAEAAQKQRQAEINAKLKTGLGVLEKPAVASDFYTAEEMEQFKPKKNKKVRRLKQKALTAEELDGLAATAAAAGEDLGSRGTREERAAAAAASVSAAASERRERFQAALSQANAASLALRNADAQPSVEGEGEEEEDTALAASLQRARALALKKAGAAGSVPSSMADQLRQRRVDAAAGAGDGGPAPGGNEQQLVFTGIGEITRTIQLAPAAAGGEERMEVEEVGPSGQQPPLPAPLPPGSPGGEAVENGHEEESGGEASGALEAGERRDSAWGNWVPAAGPEAAADKAIKEKIIAKTRLQAPKPAPAAKKEAVERDGVVGDRAIGSGMAGALAFLQSRGDLETAVEWAGRTNDSKRVNVQHLGDVYSGGRSEDRLALDVEVALTRKDEFGRILTPKEAFRQQCHKFHGIFPSKNSVEKRRRQVEEEMARKRAATGDLEGGAMEQMRAMQKRRATPYVVLSGTVRPGQSRDAAAGHASVVPGDAALDGDEDDEVPLLGGTASQAPLTGNAKVEAMLGISRGGARS